jgi:hypothetical protein
VSKKEAKCFCPCPKLCSNPRKLPSGLPLTCRRRCTASYLQVNGRGKTMSDIELRQSVYDLLSSLRGLEPLKKLFWSELNYERENQTLSRRNWTDKKAVEALAEDPILLASGGGRFSGYLCSSQLQSTTAQFRASCRHSTAKRASLRPLYFL